ncbi:MAG: helix-turn-helix transcriptional regulator [Clostridia bacterium]|jgi:DNA-binding Xre family transcriptional regulator|nr:helix-turn-helix transcriptional regulator [Clostridia bacterium]MDY5264427.1 helix-turn-helix transcriptional regulator [Eubacteriales bacterium]
MVISYDKLWKMLIDKKMTKNALRLQAEMSSSTMAKMSKNETVSMDVLLRICKVLDCEFDDIIEIKKVED